MSNPTTDRDSLEHWPERIWLQRHEDCVLEGCKSHHDGETTWCQDKINATDVEYVRADVRSAPEPSGKPLDVSHLPMGDPHPLDLVKAGKCPYCAGEPGARHRCEWREDEDGVHHTACGEMFSFSDGSPAENKASYCQYCGGFLDSYGYLEAKPETKEGKQGGANGT